MNNRTNSKSHFERGVGIVTCNRCNKRTRPDPDNCGLCALCYAKCVAENTLSDNNIDAPADVFNDCKTAQEVYLILSQIQDYSND